MNDYAALLFARPSFLEGAARTLDMGNTFTQYNIMSSPEQADAAALRSDWQAVGDDLKQATAHFATQYKLQVTETE